MVHLNHIYIFVGFEEIKEFNQILTICLSRTKVFFPVVNLELLPLIACYEKTFLSFQCTT